MIVVRYLYSYIALHSWVLRRSSWRCAIQAPKSGEFPVVPADEMAHKPNKATHSAARFAVPPTAALAEMVLSEREGSGRVRGQRGFPRNV